MKQAVNPIMPLSEYIADGEPHVFGNRIYVFGSHDSEKGMRYCEEGNYVGWSAPVDDLTDWRNEGIIYEAAQDPLYSEETSYDYLGEAGIGKRLYVEPEEAEMAARMVYRSEYPWRTIRWESLQLMKAVSLRLSVPVMSPVLPD